MSLRDQIDSLEEKISLINENIKEKKLNKVQFIKQKRTLSLQYKAILKSIEKKMIQYNQLQANPLNFNEFIDFILEALSILNQYKTPKCTDLVEIDEIYLKNLNQLKNKIQQVQAIDPLTVQILQLLSNTIDLSIEQLNYMISNYLFISNKVKQFEDEKF